MKKTAKILSILLMLALLVSSLISCREPEDPVTLWDSATYKEDVTLGSGAKTINVTVVVGENTVVFTLKTDKDTVADALLEHSLVVGEVSEQFGLTLYSVNGMVADFTVDSAYWALYVNGEYALTGVSFIEVKDGDNIKIVYEKF